MAINVRLWARRGHRWCAIVIAIPFFVVIISGILLQLKKEVRWIQPTTLRGSGTTPEISFQSLLDAARAHPDAGISDWTDIERIDVQPNRGIAKIHAKSHWEIQIDLQSGAVLQVAYRRSDLIESLHDGSWFHGRAKLGLFLPMAIIVLALWATGIYLFFLPHAVRWARQKRAAQGKR